jgi:hypothetical protein
MFKILEHHQMDGYKVAHVIGCWLICTRSCGEQRDNGTGFFPISVTIATTVSFYPLYSGTGTIGLLAVCVPMVSPHFRTHHVGAYVKTEDL